MKIVFKLPAIVLIILSFSIFSVNKIYSQTCSQIVAKTHFQALTGHENDYYYDFNLVKQIGPSGNILSSAASFASAVADFTQSRFVYSMTSNPQKLNNDYMDVNDTMLVIKMQTGTNSPLFSYKATGLQAGSNYTVKFRVYHLPKVSTSCYNTNQYVNTEIKVGVNPDSYGNGMTVKQFGSQAAGWAQYYDYTVSGTLSASQTSVDFQIWTGYNFNNCSAIGIGYVEIIGCLDAKVKSSQGSEVCTREQTLLTLDREYNAISYQWQKSTNGGTSWTTIGTHKSVVDSVLTASIYRCVFDGDQTRNFPVTTVTCCENQAGAPSSRTTVFFDDFGRFPTPNTYEDAFGVVTTGLSKANRANVNYTMPGHTYDGSGTVEDGYYAVSSYVPVNVASWFNGVPEDHSQELNGGQLLINVSYNYIGPVYDRLITGLCDGKELYFEAYIANASGTVNAPVITLNILSPDGLTTLGTATATANAGEGWKRVSVPSFVLMGYTSVRIQIISRGGEGTSGDTYWRNGNDLLLDDIKFMVCSPPSLELVTNTTTFSKEETVCSDVLDLTSLPSSLLQQYYGGEAKYLFQYSTNPSMIFTWTNIGTPSTLENLHINDTRTSAYFATVPNHGKIYFRVIAATDAIFTANNNFVNPNFADNTNYCKNYTISNNVEISFECPDIACTPPSNVVIIPSEGDRKMCPGQHVLLTSNLQPNNTAYDFTWYKNSIAPANIVRPTTTTTVEFDTLTISYADTGTYYLLVRDRFQPTDEMCYKQNSIYIGGEITPTYQLAGGGPDCESDKFSPITVTFANATPPYSITWSNGTTVNGITSNPYIVPGRNAGTYAITAISDAYCPGIPTAQSRTIYHVTPLNLKYSYTTSGAIMYESDGIFNQTDTIYTNTELNFQNTTVSPNYTYDFSWNMNSLTTGSDVFENENQFSYMYETEGFKKVFLQAVDSSGCAYRAADSIYISINPNCDMKFPNSFTPDLSTNNYFYPVYKNGILADGYELLIYDRWGHKMFETTNIYEQWDGTFKGKMCKQDVYVYHCKAQCGKKDASGNHVSFNRKGDVTIIR